MQGNISKTHAYISALKSHLSLTRISHTFFQNKREAADFLSFPYFGEKQSVCGAC